jgi:hypothetical protein
MLAQDVGESIDDGRRSYTRDVPQLLSEPAAGRDDFVLGHPAQFIALSCLVVAATI